MSPFNATMGYVDSSIEFDSPVILLAKRRDQDGDGTRQEAFM